MTNYNHTAVRKAYPNAATVIDGVGVFTEDGTPIELDADRIASFEVEATREENFLFLRIKRNQLLAETDYAALSDVTLSDEMRTYRQALRDLPANTSDPANPTWPTKPS